MGAAGNGVASRGWKGETVRGRSAADGLWCPSAVVRYVQGRYVRWNPGSCRVHAVKEHMNEKQARLIELMNELKNRQFTGFIKINFSQGGITRIEQNEEILKKAT